MKLNLNWKIRFQNPMFYLQIILSFMIPVLGYLGLNWSDVVTWDIFIQLIRDAFSNPYCLSIAAVSVFNAVVDSTSPGISDSEHVMCLKCLFGDCEEHEKVDDEEEPKKPEE